MAGEHTISMSLEGLDELVDSLNELARKYPDRAGELLQKNARELRKDVVKNVKEDTKTTGKSKRSLSKAGSYAISQVQGYGANQYVEISAKSPHFHLVEHGHELVNRAGETIGFVQGKHMMSNATKKTEQNMPTTVEGMIAELLKEGGLT